MKEINKNALPTANHFREDALNHLGNRASTYDKPTGERSMERTVKAFAALTECMHSMRNAMYSQNPNRVFHTIDPSTIKKSVGVSGKSGDKELMRKAVQGIAGSMVNVDWLDEHAIDSIAVGYSWYRSVWMGQSI